MSENKYQSQGGMDRRIEKRDRRPIMAGAGAAALGGEDNTVDGAGGVAVGGTLADVIIDLTLSKKLMKLRYSILSSLPD